MADMDPAQNLGKGETASIAEAAGNCQWAEWAFLVRCCFLDGHYLTNWARGVNRNYCRGKGNDVAQKAVAPPVEGRRHGDDDGEYQSESLDRQAF